MKLSANHNILYVHRKKSIWQKFVHDFSSWLIIVPSLIFFTVFNWQPIVSGIMLSFYQTKGYNGEKFIGLKNYVDVISDSVFRQTFINTLLYVMWSFIIGFLIPIAIAIIINEMAHFQSFFKLAVYFPSMIPGVAVVLLWAFIYDPGPNGLLNMLFGYIGFPNSQWLSNPHMTIILIVISMTWKSFGGSSILYIAKLQGINPELYEASEIEGAGIWVKIKKITIPNLSPLIKIMVIFQILGVFQIMVEPMVMTEGGPNNASMTLMLTSYFYAFRYMKVGKSLAICVLTFIILLFFTLIYFKLNKSSAEE